ncbi:MAG TPA: CpaF family protein [Vicinamibacterales bacterium]|nr:CpaF family protein [Vicinamibacterales bacterium]
MAGVNDTVLNAMAGVDVRQAQYQELKERIHKTLLNRLNLDRLNRVGRAQAEPEIRGLIVSLLDAERSTTPLSLYEREALITDVFHELFGLGPLEMLLADSSISDILVNRADQIFVEREGKIEATDLVFKDDQHLLRIIERIVSSVGRRIDESSPMVDARLADGSRVNAVIPPLALDGPCLSIRRFRTDKLGANDLVGRKSLTHPMLEFMKAAVGSRLNILVSGGTGAGKTTFLNVLSSFISDRERIVTIEDAAELVLRQRHVVRLETRPANIEGKGAVKQRQLVINSLRMRPDRIVVGEVRGEEALDMLQAMNTGHDGSLTTIHANSPRDALYRLDTMVAMADLNIPDRAVRQQVASAINLVVQLTRLSDGNRRITAISEITGMEQDVITMQDIYLFEKTGVKPDGRVSGVFRATGIRPKCAQQLASAGFHMPPELFEHRQVVE